MEITKKAFGKTPEGQEVSLFTLRNENGMTVEITNYGGIVVSLFVPDKDNQLVDVTLGYDNIEDYFENRRYFGALIGRHANRIEGASFVLNGKKYEVERNDGNNHLHGGNTGLHKVLWNAQIQQVDGGESLVLTYHSPDGEENYPGNLDLKVIYSLTNDNALKIDYYGKSDQDTVLNMTNHAYFNLAGHDSGTILDHQLQIDADFFTVINDECIPTGEIRSVVGTPMDFRELTTIKPGLETDDEQIRCGQGYDHNWVLRKQERLSKAATLYHPASGKVMEVFTTKPGIQFYSGNFVEDDEGKNGAVYQKWAGLCLETQFFPNSLKHTHFPSPILKAGEEYHHTTIFKFSNK
ncbi:MAG: galactose mutarotase [Firmicutes bacterium]|nr:galactose mutarotase [Bacillota bacterium]